MSDDPADLELADLHKKVAEMRAWLDEAFDAGCAEDDYTEGCTSCDAGIAIKHLRLIEKQLVAFLPKPTEV